MKETKRKMAAALRYDHEAGTAPTVIATGYGTMAERIIERAAELHVPIQVNSVLAPLLVGLKLDDEIPLELYKTVAGILAVVLSIDNPKKS
ncbi:MAG: Flagellar biosynthesis pathway component FlhB [Bacillota bacterium]|nr:MAG: Flagellar biosynthesis pathway component FlhB [Bacillota bacterium]MBS3950218.1 EscU/YscU/HrcU family type III secretion system export apparatus switch protein [Peptococcaceae bacterium]